MLEIKISQLTGHAGARPPAALVRSIQDQGFLPAFPIVVAEGANATYRILDGRRRTAAAEKTGLETVLAVVTESDAALTILAHSTRSENPVAELKAYQALMRSGMSEGEIAQAGYASLQRIRRIAKLNRLAPELAERVESGEIAPGVGFQIAALAPEVQQELAEEERITGAVVKDYRSARRREAVLGTPDLVEVFQVPAQATVEEVFAALSAGTLEAILDELPTDGKFAAWRGKIRQALSLSGEAFLPLELADVERSSVEQVR